MSDDKTSRFTTRTDFWRSEYNDIDETIKIIRRGNADEVVTIDMPDELVDLAKMVEKLRHALPTATNQPGQVTEFSPAGDEPQFSIRARIAQLGEIRKNYLTYQQDRVNERDHHGAWDVAVNLSETECEIAGLQFALDAMAGAPR